MTKIDLDSAHALLDVLKPNKRIHNRMLKANNAGHKIKVVIEGTINFDSWCDDTVSIEYTIEVDTAIVEIPE